jgi:filamentous hemagglutinin
MNKIHRVIWSVRTGSWVVVAETTKSRGKGGGRTVGKALLAVLIASGMGAGSALADKPATTVIPASGKTNAYISANGVPVVNIDTANAKGLSHNRYTRYDVEANGLVLNNGNNSQIARQSQLAGQVTANLNLVKEATVILNEVVSVKRSTLAGYTEVLGGKADVVVANPYGITCDGCGFINTDRATLTTGTSTIGVDGSLTGFTVNSGDVLIGAQGIDSTAQQVLDMVTRSVKIEGNINTSPTGSLGITTGNNSWNYGSRNTTGTVTGNGAAPSYAIDSTALGGMYAGRIRIIGTEAGVGVRMLGDAAASVDDFTISYAGKVEIHSAISAARDVAIASTSSTGNSDVFVNGLGAQLSAGQDLTVLATNGQVTLSEAELYAANNLDVTAASLSDVSTTDKTRFAGAVNTLVVSGEASINGSVWGAGSALSGKFGSLSVGANGATIYAGTTLDLSTTNALALANAAVRSTGDMTLAASAGTISTTSGTGQGVQATNGNLSLTAGNGLNNAGTITSDTGSVTARVDGTLNNSGTLHAKTTVDIADKANSSTENIINSGTLIADGSLVAKAGNFTNQTGATVQGTTGTTVTATALINDGTFIASDTAGQSGNFTLSSLSNSGTLQSKEDLGLNVTGTLANAGKLLATHDLAVNAATSALAISNTNPGVIQAGNALTISGANATFNTQSGTVLGNTTGITVSSLSNSGTLQSNASMNLAIGNGLTNSGTLLAKTSLTSNSGSLNNSGTLQTNQGSTITTGALTNSGKIITSSAGYNGVINAATLTNTGVGVIQSARNLNVNIRDTLTNAGQLLTDSNLTVRGTDSYYSVSDTGRMQAGGLLDVRGLSGGKGVNITMGGSGVMLGNSVVLNAGTLAISNGGMLTSPGAMTVGLTSLFLDGSSSRIVGNTNGGATTAITLGNGFNNFGAIHSGGTLNFYAPSITNNISGGFSALGTLNLRATAGYVNNHGALYAGSLLDARAARSFTNHSTGTIDSNGSLSLIAGSGWTFTNNNSINALQDITIVSTSFNNVITGGVPSRKWGVTVWAPCTGSCNGSWTITGMSGSWGWPTDATEYYKKTGTQTQSFSSSIPPTKPQIIANRNMTISGFSSAVNGGGVLAANSGTLTITGTGTFTNDDLSLESRAWSKTAKQYQDCDLDSCDAGVFTYNTPVKVTSAQANPYKAGIYANTLVATGFGLVNRGSPWAATTTTSSESGVSATGGANGTAVSVPTTSGAPAISFNGLIISLPTNPNGYFVISQNPSSEFLVETNPLFSVGSPFVGSDYMAKRYGYNPDLVIKRLGDSNYEAYLIRQQLIDQTGNNILSGYGSEADQMKRLMDQAVVEGKQSGFVFGQSLTPDQISNLKEDVVWMVETTVAGQKVLAPVVYLSAATRDSIATGAVIVGNNVELNLTTVSNTGGTISGSNSLNITAQGDITNTSGAITGGDVSVKSIEGSIENKTLVSGSGGAENYATSIGKTAGIVATGNLDLDAKKDITVLGAEVKAGGDASLAAGGNVTFDTIVDKTTGTTHSSSSNGLQTTTTSNTTTTENNIGSTLESGGNLKIKSGGDTTIAGSDASVGGDLSVDAGGDFNVLARQDKVTSKTVTETSGLGVGGGVAGTEKTTTDDFKGTNSGSTLTVGGNATVKADKSMTVQGSDVTIAGDADINAKEGINILDGLDESRTNTVTETTTYLKIDSEGESDSSSDSSSGTQSGPGRANATASAEASAEASGTSDIKFAETTTTSTQAGSNTSVSSNFKVGGNLKATTEGTLKVQGSNVESGGDMELDAKNVEVLTGRNEEWTNTQTVRTSVGIYNEGEAKAEAGADAQAKAGTEGTDASASAKASAEASGTTTIGARTENEETTDYSLTNSSSTLKSGGSMSIKAKEAAVFVGAEVESGGDMNIEATDILNMAAQDITLKTSSKKTDTAGLYIDAKVSAEAGAEADAGKINAGGDPANAKAGAKGSADVSAGVRYKTEKESSIEGSVTQVTSGFKSGGNFTRKATNEIVDQGTQIEAGGDINQSARAITEIEANDSTFSSKDSSSHDMKLGVGASASAEASGNAKGETESDAGAGAGLRAKYEGSIDSESESTTTAVTTKYKSGGSINSKSEEKTTLIGTQFESGGDINIEAGSLEYKAAKDTTSMSSDANKIDAELKVDVVGKAGGSLEASYGNKGKSGSASTARTGGINAGGSLTIKTKGDASFEGTQIEAGGAAAIDAGGSVDFKAARDTSESSKSTIDASVELSASKGSKGAAAKGGYSQEDSSSSKAQAGSIKAGSGGINISAGKDASFEGTALKSEGDTAIDAGGNVNLKSAKNTETTTSFGVEASIGAEKGATGTTKKGSIGGSAAYANKVDSDATSIESGGKLIIKGNNVVNQEANIKAKEGTQVIGNEVKIKAEKSDISVGIEASVSSESEPEKKSGGPR